MNDSDVTALFGKARDEAEAASQAMGPPDISAAIAGARTAKRPLAGRVPQIAAMAATLIVALGLVLVVQEPPLPSGEVPAHLSLLVDSLYEDESYLITNIAPRWSEIEGEFMNDIWDEVVDELAVPES